EFLADCADFSPTDVVEPSLEEKQQFLATARIGDEFDEVRVGWGGIYLARCCAGCQGAVRDVRDGVVGGAAEQVEEFRPRVKMSLPFLDKAASDEKPFAASEVGGG